MYLKYLPWTWREPADLGPLSSGPTYLPPQLTKPDDTYLMI